MLKKFTKLQVDYMYLLLEYVYNNYNWNWNCNNNFIQYQWENKYNYYKFLYFKSQYPTTDIFEANVNIYHWVFYNSLYNSLKYIYVKPCLQSKIDLIQDLQNDFKDNNFISFVNNILTEL